MSSPGSVLARGLKVYAIALGLAVVLTVGGLVAVNAAIDRKIESIERVPNLDLAVNTGSGEPANFLLIGSDTRGFADTPAEEEAFGDPETQTGQRSDTLMVVHVDPAARTGLLVSFPRDLLVDIPGIGRSKVNAAYNEGEQKVIDTLEENFDIPIHHYLEIDFASFEGIVNAVGGVQIYLTTPVRDEVSGLDIFPFAFEPGCYVLDGATALAYVRSRAFEQYIDDQWVLDPRGDIGRIERQQAFMRRLATEAVKRAIANPLGANRIADKSLAQLKADEDLSRTDVNKLIQAFRRVDPNDLNSIEMITIPWEDGPNYNGQDVVYLDEEGAAPVLERLRTLAPPPPAPEGPVPQEIRVRVFNGSGVNGAAADTLAALEQQGYQSGGTGNNPGGNIASTEVRYRPGSKDKAEVTRSSLGGVGKLVEDDSIVEADVLVVIGRDFDGVTAPPGSTAPTTVPSVPTSAPAAEPGAEGEDAAAPEITCY